MNFKKAVYPNFINKGEIYAEDIEQTIIDYLNRLGIPYDDLLMEHQNTDGSHTTTKRPKTKPLPAKSRKENITNTCDMRCLDNQLCNIPENQAPCATNSFFQEKIQPECPVCGGRYVITNLECQNCYGDYEGTNCGTDSCTAFGIGTEERCRCENPPPNLPVYTFDEFQNEIPSKCMTKNKCTYCDYNGERCHTLS